MFPNLDPRKMQAVMKQMGINQEEVDASRVIIEKSDSSKIVIENPSVTRIKMQGQESFQIAGDVSESSSAEETSFSEEDVKILMEKTSCSRKEAEAMLRQTGDLAEAIMKLS